MGNRVVNFDQVYCHEYDLGREDPTSSKTVRFATLV